MLRLQCTLKDWWSNQTSLLSVVFNKLLLTFWWLLPLGHFCPAWYRALTSLTSEALATGTFPDFGQAESSPLLLHPWHQFTQMRTTDSKLKHTPLRLSDKTDYKAAANDPTSEWSKARKPSFSCTGCVGPGPARWATAHGPHTGSRLTVSTVRSMGTGSIMR